MIVNPCMERTKMESNAIHNAMTLQEVSKKWQRTVVGAEQLLLLLPVEGKVVVFLLLWYCTNDILANDLC